MTRPVARGAAGASPRAETAERVLQGAIRVLKRDGFARLSARTVAAEAGTNLALLNYYFGTKEHLLLAIFERLDEELQARQREMYSDAARTLSEKWRRAVAFYRRDLADGYVRVLQELTAYGYSNPSVGARVRERMAGWRELIADALRQHADDVDLPWDPDLIATTVTSFWWGMEEQHLVGVTDRSGRFFELLDLVGDLIERLEREHGHRRARRRR